jgi:predicted nucleotidyltransferase
MSLEKLLKENREQILAIAARHGAHNLRLFGSVARGEADDKSDIDILVTFDSNRSLLDHAGLILELEELLGRKVDVISDKSLRPRVRDNVMRDALPL